MAQPTIDQLRNELINDPVSMGYSGNNVEQMTEMINEPDEPKHGTVDVESVTKEDMQKAVVATEWSALADAPKERLWQSILALDSVPVSDTNIRNQIQEIWGVGTTTRSNLVALQTRPASRAEALWGAGITISKTEVRQAIQS
jgi:hypothetical protein